MYLPEKEDVLEQAAFGQEVKIMFCSLLYM